jgi:GNAT superfamily N-acetyltransferase
MKYDRNDLNLRLEFSPKLTRSEVDWAFDLTKEHMEDRYDNSGYGWDDDDKRRELTEQGTRFILVRENVAESSSGGKLLGFVHFRFTVQGEIMDTMAGEPCLFLWDIHLEESVQRKGLGKHLLTLLELIARREKMKYVAVPIQLNDEWAKNWIQRMKGYQPDSSLYELVGFDSEVEVLSLYK